MTKFEEKLEILPIKTIQHPVGDTKYYTAVHVKTLIAQADEEIANLKSKLQQQALPVVPEHVADYISELKEKGHGIQFGLMCSTYDAAGEGNEKAIHWKDDNAEDFARAWLDGYTVEKPQLFRVCLLDGRHTLTRRDPRKTLPFNYTFLWSYSSELKEMREINRKVDLFTEQEIKSIDERYWQFAVPVEV